MKMSRSEADKKVEALILEVEKNPPLYDKTSELFKETLKKDDIWKSIAESLGFNSVKEVKQKWKTVRDNYRRYLNSTKTKSGQAARSVPTYKFAGILEFLKPSLDDRETVSNISEAIQVNEVDDDDIEDDARSSDGAIEDIPVASESGHSRSSTPNSFRHPSAKKRRSKDQFDDVVVDYFSSKKRQLENRDPSVELDHIDSFMKSMGDIVRQLPPRAVAEVKFRIHGIIHEAQMKHMFPVEVEFNRPNSSSHPEATFQRGPSTSLQPFSQSFGCNVQPPSCTVSRPMTEESSQEWSLL